MNPNANRSNEVESRPDSTPAHDRFDRRFVIDGDPIEALRAVLDDHSGKLF